MRRVAAVLLLLSLATGCWGEGPTAPKDPDPETPELDPSVVSRPESRAHANIVPGNLPRRVIRDGALTDDE